MNNSNYFPGYATIHPDYTPYYHNGLQIPPYQQQNGQMCPINNNISGYGSCSDGNGYYYCQSRDFIYRCNLFSNCINTVTSNYIFDYNSIKNINDINQLKRIVDNHIDMIRSMGKEILVVIVDDLNSIPSLPLLALISVCAEHKRSLVICNINDNRTHDDLEVLFFRGVE